MNTTTKTESMNPESILELAKKAAYVALRTMAIKSGDPNMQKLQLAIPHYPDCDHDAQDIVSQAALLLLESQDKDNAFIEAVKGIHRYVYAQKRKKADQGKLWIDDPETGELENVNNSIHRLINCIYADEVINSISALLSPTQRKILKYVAYGYDYITIAKRINISENTIKVHMHRIREKALTLYPNGIDFDAE